MSNSLIIRYIRIFPGLSDLATLPSICFLAPLGGFIFLRKAPSTLGGINNLIILAEIDQVEVAHVPMTALAWLHRLLLGDVCII